MAETGGGAAQNARDGETDCTISILIVGYNSTDFIERCISSIGPAISTQNYQILFVDNGDGSTEALVKDTFPKVQIVPSRGNIGFAGGNNLLAAHANAPRLLLLNPDMTLEPGSLDALLDGAQQHCDASAWGGVTVDAQGQPDSGNAIAMPSMLEFASVALGHSLVGGRPVEGVHEDCRADVLVGGFVMFDRAAWEQVSGLDERFFLYSEEVDLFYRLAANGHTFWRIAKARGRHDVAHGLSFSPTRLMYRAAGQMEFVRRHWSTPAAFAAFAFMWIGALERYVAGRVLGVFKPRMKNMADGYRNVALRPHWWMRGYDRKRGLLTKLKRAD